MIEIILFSIIIEISIMISIIVYYRSKIDELEEKTEKQKWTIQTLQNWIEINHNN